jgi:hypothetical protein
MIALFRRPLLSTALSTVLLAFAFAAASSVTNCGGGGGSSSGTGGAGATAGTGGISGSSDPVVICKETCNVFISLCVAEAGATAASLAKGICEGACATSLGAGDGGTASACTNSSAIASAYQACLTKTTCADVMACQSSVPACAGASRGTGGAAGGGTGGSSGSTTGCAGLLACCNASTNTFLKNQCMMNYSTLAAMGDASCQQLLDTYKTQVCP